MTQMKTGATAAEIAHTVERLASELRGRLFDVSLSVDDGGVILRGRAQSYYVKQLAQHAVMQHVSLPIQMNAIEVNRI